MCTSFGTKRDQPFGLKLNSLSFNIIHSKHSLSCARQRAKCFYVQTLESPLDSKEIKPVNPKGNQLWTFIGRTDAEAPIFWPPDAKSQLVWKDPSAGKDWRQEEKGTTRGWDGWMASPTQWTWVWANSGRWWRTGKPGVLQFMGLQRVSHDWATERQQQLESIQELHERSGSPTSEGKTEVKPLTNRQVT